MSKRKNYSPKPYKALRTTSYVVAALLLIILACGLTLNRLEENPGESIFGKRFQAVTESDNTILAVGSLAIITVNGEYAANEAVSYLYTNEEDAEVFGISTAAYLEEGSYIQIIGVVKTAIPIVGAVFASVAFYPAVAAAFAILGFGILTMCIVMGNKNGGKLKIQQRKRIGIQTMWFIATNSYMIGYVQGTIYQGDLKKICVPGLNCYSCPGAWGSCPIGALQSIFNTRTYSADGTRGYAYYFPFYVVGMLIIFGALCGRLVCGFLCPFGWIQELLHKIPLPKKMKINTFAGDKMLRYLKFVVLVVLVIAMPLLMESLFPWFCKLLCPSGMAIGGIPLMSVNDGLRNAAGSLTILKLSILAFLVLLSVALYRPFCKYLCPLGAIYGLLNPISFYRYSVDVEKCTDCGICAKTCSMGIDIRKTPNPMECIRCGDCRASCPKDAIHAGFTKLPSRIKTDEAMMN